MSKLLLDESPLLILPRLAAAIGLNEAIILQQIHYWVELYKKANDEHHFQDGKWWVWNTGPEWQENFPFWSERTIWRIIDSLRSAYETKKKTNPKLSRGPLIITGNFNIKGYDRTLWYRIDYNELARLEETILTDCQDGNFQPDKAILTDCQDGDCQSVKMEIDTLSTPIPETTQKTTQEITTNTPEKTGDALLDQFFQQTNKPTNQQTNYTIPVQAGGADSPAHAIVDGICRYNGLAQGVDSLPAKKRTSWTRHVAEIVAGWGGATVAQACLAWQAWAIEYEWKTNVNPFYNTFETELGPLLVGVREGTITTETLKQKIESANGGNGHGNRNPKRSTILAANSQTAGDHNTPTSEQIAADKAALRARKRQPSSAVAG